MKQIITFFKKRALYLGVARYLLGLVMIFYSITKILQTQFVVVPFLQWQQPLESLSGKTIAWAFLGHSPWFEILLGFLELIPGILLLFRRTILLGAILLLPVTLNVFLINHALNLWDDTKVISLILLILNIIVLMFEWRRIKGLALTVLGSDTKFKGTIAEVVINFVVVAVITYLGCDLLFGYINQKNVLIGDWYHRHPNEWILQSEKIGDSTLRHRLVKSYYDVGGSYSEVNDTGTVWPYNIYYKLDEKNKTLNFYNSKYQAVLPLQVRFAD